MNAIPSEPTWPPPPDVLNPLAEHDALITSLVCAAAAKPPLSRLRLYRELHLATGKDLRQCFAVVNNYCDRYGIFPQRKGLQLWMTLLTALAQFGLLAMWIGGQVFLTREINTAPTRAMRHLLLWDRVKWDSILLGFIIVGCVASLIVLGVGQRRLRREAEEAKARVLG